jgi:hypothetical protein
MLLHHSPCTGRAAVKPDLQALKQTFSSMCSPSQAGNSAHFLLILRKIKYQFVSFTDNCLSRYLY